MKQKTIEKIMVAYNELVNTNSDISSRILADKANTSLRNAQEFLRDLKTASDKSVSNKTESESVSESLKTESVSNKMISDKTESLKTESALEQRINVETGEGYIKQLNKLFKEGIITKEEYIDDVIRSNRNYPNFLPKPFMKKFFEKINENNSTKY